MIFSVSGSSAQEVRDTVVVAENWKYVGQWPQGKGVLYSEKEGLYVGIFNEGRPEGLCMCISADIRQTYYGNFKDGKRSGFGILSRPGHFYYEGNFENGYPEGNGRLYYPTRMVYYGVFHLGKPDHNVGKTYVFSNKKDFESKLPVFPDIKLTKEQKRFLKSTSRMMLKKGPDDSYGENDRRPMFLGNDLNTFPQWVNARLEYPMDAFRRGVGGKVVLQFTLTEKGELADPYVLDTSGIASLDVEALRVLCTSPDWTPAFKNGRYVSVTYRFPVYFSVR